MFIFSVIVLLLCCCCFTSHSKSTLVIPFSFFCLGWHFPQNPWSIFDLYSYRQVQTHAWTKISNLLMPSIQSYYRFEWKKMIINGKNKIIWIKSGNVCLPFNSIYVSVLPLEVTLVSQPFKISIKLILNSLFIPMWCAHFSVSHQHWRKNIHFMQRVPIETLPPHCWPNKKWSVCRRFERRGKNSVQK